MANTARTVITFADSADADLVKRAAARLGMTSAAFIRMAGIKEARNTLDAVPEVRKPRGRPLKAK